MEVNTNSNNRGPTDKGTSAVPTDHLGPQQNRSAHSLEDPAISLRELQQLLEDVRPWLPLQNPLASFVHNNPLMRWEVFPFRAAVTWAAPLYRAHAYLPLAEYESYLQAGEIDAEILQKHLQQQENNSSLSQDSQLALLVDYRRLQKDHLQHPWREQQKRKLHDFVIPLIASYLDQGVGSWNNPFWEEGLWAYFLWTIKKFPRSLNPWQLEITRQFPQLYSAPTLDILQQTLRFTHLPSSQWCFFVLDRLMELKGWSGIVNKMEKEREQAPIKAPKIQLEEWATILLVCEHSVMAFLDNAHNTDLLHEHRQVYHSQTLPLVYFLQNAANLPVDVHLTTPLRPLESFWHEAFEETCHRKMFHHLQQHLAPLSALTLIRQAPGTFQVVFCMDDRETILRAHLEDVFPEVETFGVAGFYNVDMWFLDLGKSRAHPACPPAIRPQHFVRETLLDPGSQTLPHSHSHTHAHASRKIMQKSRVHWRKLALSSFYHSRSLLRGFTLSLLYGLMSYIPLSFKTLFPGTFRRLWNAIQKKYFPPSSTQLLIDENGGYSPSEMAQIVLSILQNMGLLQAEHMAPWIVILGHGSTTTNNPFRQAYGCGACGGHSGSASARAFVKMANRLDVRDLLAQGGVHIPASTVFLAGLHDTCSDEITLWTPEHFQQELQKATLMEALVPLRAAFTQATQRVAMVRCQQFASFPEHLKQNPRACVEHVKDRSRDLAQPRPEYGHSGIALSIIGRRHLTRQLHFPLNERCFLVSYDPQVDPDGSILYNVVCGTLPVAVNISLDYYFSRIDPEGFGAGSKLPLNISGILGVMTGSKSDLRIGLAQQMTEVHRPLRPLALIEGQAQHIANIFIKNQRLKLLRDNEWFMLGKIDPATQAISLWSKGDQWKPI